MKKVCKRCNIEYTLNLYNFYKKGNYFSNRCKKCTKIENKLNYKKHRNKYLKQKADYWIDNKDRIAEYRNLNINSINETRRKYSKKRKENDKLYKLRKDIPEGIRCAFERKGLKKKSKTKDILGCEYDKFFCYLKKRFESTYLVPYRDCYYDHLHLDHIIPISEAKNESDILKLNHYTNFQFLYKKDNILKSNNLNWELDLYSTEFYENCLRLR
jgi:hypothetical protein